MSTVFYLMMLRHISLFYDDKSTLAGACAERRKNLTYALLEEKGPDHNKSYVSEVCINGEHVATGEGASRKASEQTAAYNALLQIKKKQG